MKTIQILLRHRVAPIKASAALRQMCVWVNPADTDYTASYDPLVAKWSAFEKDMADVRSQREGPLRWNPPSYKNEDFLLLQKNQPTKPSTRGLRKQNSRTSSHRPIPHNTVIQDVLDAHTKQNFQKRTPDFGASIKNKRQEIDEEEQMPQKSSSSVDAHTKQNFQKGTPDYGASVKNKRQKIDEEEQIPQKCSSSADAHTKQNFQKRTPDYGASVKNKRQETDEEEQMPQKSSSSMDMPRRRAQVREASFKGNPTEIQAPGRGEISSESAIQESFSREVPLEDVTVKEVSQKLARPTVLEAQTKKNSQKKSSGHRTLFKTRRQEYKEEDRMPQMVSSSSDMLRRRAPSRKTLFEANQSAADATGKAETFIESVLKEIPSREVPLKEFAATEEFFEETEGRTPLIEAPVKKNLSREVSENVDSFKEVADSEALAPERPGKSQEHSAKGISRETSTYVSSAHEELNERDLAQEIAAKIAPLREAPKKKIILRERLDATEKRNTKNTLKKVPSGEESFKKAPMVHAIHKSAINSMNEVKGSEERGFQRNESKLVNLDSSLESNTSQQLNDDILTSISDEGAMKESTTFSKKKYEALRKYIAEAEVELRVQKQMLYTQKEDFKRRLRKMALNPLAEIERNSKVYLQHPLDYFNQKNKILRTGMKNQKKVSDEVNINSSSLSKSIESIPVQSQLQESSEAIIDNQHSINMTAIEDEVIAEPNPQSNFTEIPPEEHQGKGNKLEGRSRNKTSIQGRSKEMLDKLGNVESTELLHSIQSRKKISKQSKNQFRTSDKSDIRHENSDNIDVGESRQQGIIDLKKSSEKVRSSKNINQRYIRKPSGNLESPALLEMSSTISVVPESATGSKVTKSRPLSKEIYDYFDGDQSVPSSNQLNPQNPVKRKIATESFSDKSIPLEGNQGTPQCRTKLRRVIDSQPAIKPVRSGQSGPLPQENDKYRSLESRETEENPQQEIYKDIGDSELKQQKGTGVATTSQVGRASSILDRSRAKLRKHFMDRSAPIRLNKNAAYIYHPSESTISTMTKTALDTVGNSDIPPIPVLSTYTGSENQATLEENDIEAPSNQEYEHFLTSPSELVYLPEQARTTNAQKLPESNLTTDQIKDDPSEGLDDAMRPMKNNLTPADDSATSKTLPQKDNSALQPQKKINVKQESKVPSIPATNENVRSKYQEDDINKIVYTDAYLSSSKNKPIPEYNYFNTSGVETRPNAKDIILKSNDKQYPEQEKTKFFSVNELSATGQTAAPEKYDFLSKKSELSTEKTFGSQRQALLLKKLSKTNNAKYKQQIRSGGGSISLESYLSNLPNNYQPVSAHSVRINSEYYLSKDSPESKRPEIQIYNHKMSSTAAQPHLLHQNQFNNEPGSKKTRHNPEIEFNTIMKSDPKKQSSKSLEKLYPSLQSTHETYSSNSVREEESDDSSARTNSSNIPETDFNNNFKKSVKGVFASESNSKRSVAIDTLQDIEEGIPSSRVKLRPALDAFTSFGVGKVASESESSSNPYPRLQTRSTNTKSITAASNSQSLRSRSMPLIPFVKVNTPQEGNSAKDTRVLKGKSRYRSHSSSRTGTTELSQLRTSRRIRDRYPTLFKHDQNSDPFDEIFPFPYEKSDTYKNLLSNIPEGTSHPVTLQSNSLDSQFKKSLQDNLNTGSTMFNKSKAPVVREETRLSQEQFVKDSFQQAKTISPNEWPERVTQSNNFIESTCGNSVAHHKSYRFDPPTQTQSGMIPSVQGPMDQSKKRYRPKSGLTSRVDQNAQHFDVTNDTITFQPGEIETSKKRKPILYKKPDLSKTKLRPRFISPSTYDVENVDSFFRVDESIQLPGSPIRKWKVVPKETGRVVYVASIPQNKTSS